MFTVEKSPGHSCGGGKKNWCSSASSDFTGCLNFKSLLLVFRKGSLSQFTVLCEKYQPSIERDPVYKEVCFASMMKNCNMHKYYAKIKAIFKFGIQ